MNNEKLIAADFENLLKKIIQMRSIDQQLSKQIVEMMQMIKKLNVGRYEKSALTMKVIQKE